MKNRYAVCCAIALLSLALPASAGDGLRLGVQGGLGQWEMGLNVPVLSRSDTLSPDSEPALGVVAQYLFNDNEQDYFVGFEAGFAQENISHTQTFDVADIPVSVTNDINWGVDLLWLVGYDFGKVTGFLAGGGSYIDSELTVDGAGIVASDGNNHIGWKIGPGVEIDLGNSAVLIRANYGLHQGKKYTGSAVLGGTDFNVDVDLEPRFFEVRVAWVYEFGGLSNLFKRQ